MSGRWRYGDRVKLSRLGTVVGVVALGGGLLVGCSPEPEPTPTPTAAFASEEDAFAAAEKVYREYNDAANARIAGKPSPDPQDYLSGLALEADISTQNLLQENGVHLQGAGVISSFDGSDSDIRGTLATIFARVCLDASGTIVANADGEDVTPSDRPDVSALEVTFSGTPDRLLIVESDLAAHPAC